MDTGATDFTLNPGDVVNGRFEVVRPLGSGGFATVYVARQLNIGREVALKLLGVHFDPRQHSEMWGRFEREARVAAQIDHPSVVTIHDYGIYDATGQPFIVMELLRGHDLEHEIDNHGPLALERALPLFGDALDALATGHRLDVVHKDLKPSNLFLAHPRDRQERLVVLDFGIAGVQDKARLTATGQVLGTPQYLAPEYIRDQLVSPTIDVYQMGLILVEMLTGSPVVNERNAMRCMMIHSKGLLEIPEALRSGPLGVVLGRALALDHTQRFPDAGAFSEAIQAVAMDVCGPMSSGQFPARIPRVQSGDLARPTTGDLLVAAKEDGEFADTVASSVPAELRASPVAAASEELAGAGSRWPLAITAALVVVLLAVTALVVVLLFSQ